jgi:hypothetical protein
MAARLGAAGTRQAAGICVPLGARVHSRCERPPQPLGQDAVRIEEQPQFQLLVDPSSRFKDNVEVAGLLLCKIPEEFMDQRREYFARQNRDQIESVDNNFMRENDPRMPLFRERKSSASFGKGT